MPTNTCRQCGREFGAYRASIVFCSPDCFALSYHAPRQPRRRIECPAEFVPTSRLHKRCASCRKLAAQRLRDKHSKLLNERRNRLRKTSAAFRERELAYRLRHREKHIARQRLWRANNRQRHRESVKVWKKLNKDKSLAWSRGYRKRAHVKKAAADRRWRKMVAARFGGKMPADAMLLEMLSLLRDSASAPARTTFREQLLSLASSGVYTAQDIAGLLGCSDSTVRKHANALPQRQRPLKTHCCAGHEFSAANTSIRTNGYRRCLKCHAAYARKWRSGKR
jgi:DNA invertase Pin-like site-specific DNA recombinase